MQPNDWAKLVSTTTDDGVTLHGALYAEAGEGESPASSTRPVDVVLAWHGVGGNFYSGRMFAALRESLQAQGVALLCANTRGHDLMYTAAVGGKPKRLGAAYEIVDECRHDLRAWVGWLGRHGLERVGLLGHSLGAIKAIYAQAAESLPGVRRLISLSAPSLTQRRLLGSAMGDRFREDCDVARRLIEAGRPDELFEARVPFPLLISAAAHQDKYGPADRYDILAALPKLETRSLLMYGSLELPSPNGAFANLPEQIEQLGNARQCLTVEVMRGADHFYSGRHAAVASRVSNWLFETVDD